MANRKDPVVRTDDVKKDETDLIAKTVCRCLNKSFPQDDNKQQVCLSSQKEMSSGTSSSPPKIDAVLATDSCVDRLMLDNLKNHQHDDKVDRDENVDILEDAKTGFDLKSSGSLSGNISQSIDEQIYVESDRRELTDQTELMSTLAELSLNEHEAIDDSLKSDLLDVSQDTFADTAAHELETEAPAETKTETAIDVSVAPQTTYTNAWFAPLPGIAVVVWLAFIGGIFGKSMPVETPAATETFAYIEAEIDQLLDEIATIQKQISTEQAKLGQQLSLNPDSPSVTHWQRINQKYLFSPFRVEEMDNNLLLAKAQIDEGQLEKALMGLKTSKIEYSNQLAQLLAGSEVYGSQQAAIKAQKRWELAQKEYNLKSPIYVEHANIAEQDAKVAVIGTDFTLGSNYWELATTLWHLSYDSSLDQINRIKQARLLAAQRAKAERLAAEAAAQAEEQRVLEIAAAEEAKRYAAIAEAQRLAEIEAEKTREIERQRLAEERRKEELRRQKLAAIAIGKLVDIPAGEFIMGCNTGDECLPEMQPARPVSVSAFKMGESEVTFEQWDACVELGGCTHRPVDKGWGRGTRPVINVSFQDITEQFIPTLNKQTGRNFRLPTEAEWEYAARAGSETDFAWGETLGSGLANCINCGSEWDNTKTSLIKSFQVNAFGLFDMHGNVFEWTQDCWRSTYKEAPVDGSAYLGTSDKDEFWVMDECRKRVLRGGAWSFPTSFVRSSARNWNPAEVRSASFGFRLAE